MRYLLLDGMPPMLMMVIGAIIILIITAFITRAIFSIPSILRALRAIVKLLGIIAKKDSKNHEEIDSIIEEGIKKGDIE